MQMYYVITERRSRRSSDVNACKNYMVKLDLKKNEEKAQTNSVFASFILLEWKFFSAYFADVNNAYGMRLEAFTVKCLVRASKRSLLRLVRCLALALVL